jgi:hypothetical protein
LYAKMAGRSFSNNMSCRSRLDGLHRAPDNCTVAQSGVAFGRLLEVSAEKHTNLVAQYVSLRSLVANGVSTASALAPHRSNHEQRFAVTRSICCRRIIVNRRWNSSPSLEANRGKPPARLALSRGLHQEVGRGSSEHWPINDYEVSAGYRRRPASSQRPVHRLTSRQIPTERRSVSSSSVCGAGVPPTLLAVCRSFR